MGALGDLDGKEEMGTEICNFFSIFTLLLVCSHAKENRKVVETCD